MPITRKQVAEADLDAELENILTWVDSLPDDDIKTLIRAYIPEDERVEKIPSAGDPRIIYTTKDQSAPLRKSTDAMKVITDSFNLRKASYTRDIISEKHIAFTICPLAFIEII